MESQIRFIEFVIADFIEDPVDDAAFAINFQINGPADRVEYLRVSFNDEFVEDYFRVRWNQDLGKEETRLVRQKRELFIRWAIFRLERWIKENRPEENIQITPKDLEWTKAVELGTSKPISQMRSANTYLFAYR